MTTHSQLTTVSMNYQPDRAKAKNPLQVQDLSLRDGHQSLFATRLSYSQGQAPCL